MRDEKKMVTEAENMSFPDGVVLPKTISMDRGILVHTYLVIPTLLG